MTTRISLSARLRQHLPHRCLLCQHYGRGDRLVCPGCTGDLPWLGPTCMSCALPLTLPETNELLCTACTKSRTAPIAFAISCFRYTEPISTLIRRWKHHGDMVAGQALADLAARGIRQRYQQQGLSYPDLLVPVPLHWQRQFSRGFNQSELLARQLGKALSIPVGMIARKIHHTASQQQQSRQQRLINLTNAFDTGKTVPPANIAIVDDVVTTGATTNTLARLLLANGARSVHVWSIARTPQKPEDE